MAAATRKEPTSLASMSGALAETLFRHYGIDPGPLYERAGLDPAMIGRAGARYPYLALRRLWDEAMRATGDPCLGLVVGQNLRAGSSQVLGFAWLASSTLEDALDRWVRYHRVASTAVVMERGDEDGEGGMLCGHCAVTRRTRYRIATPISTTGGPSQSVQRSGSPAWRSIPKRSTPNTMDAIPT